VRSEPLARRAGTVVLWVFNAAVRVRPWGEAVTLYSHKGWKMMASGWRLRFEDARVAGKVS
jgi:hypothetical protein